MKVILLEDIKSIGKRWEVKDVSDGFARNKLFPNKQAMPGTPENLKKLEAQKARFNKEEEELKKELRAIARALEERSLVFPLKTNEEGKVFGSVSKEMINQALRDNRFITKEHVEIKMAHPIKEVGEHEISVDLKKGITARLKIIVRAEK